MRSLVIGAVILLAACPSDDQDVSWQLVQTELPGALMSAWAGGPDDVWAVGADTGSGSTALHYDGTAWRRIDTGTTGDLWWVHGFAGGPVFFGGEGGMVLRYDGTTFEPVTTPSSIGIVFGLWGASPDEMWAVGGNQGGTSGAFAWRMEGGQLVEAPGFPTELASTDAIWKVFGRSASDVVMVGTNGNVLRYNGETLSPESSGASVSLFTVHGNADLLVAVGGFGTGAILENDGTGWVDAAPDNTPQLIGVAVGTDEAYAVGVDGVVYRRDVDGVWTLEPTGTGSFLPLHAACIDTGGGVWAVGGQVLSEPLVSGYLIHKGSEVPGGIQP